MPDASEVDVDIVLASLPFAQETFPDTQPKLRTVALAELSATLDALERARASGYKVAEAAQVFVLARGLLRAELSRRLDESAQDIQFDLRPSGKPDIRRRNALGASAPRPDWRFSVSHTGPHVCLAFARGRDVGVDIERATRPVRPLDIAKRYFTAREFKALEAVPDAVRNRAFFAGWTRKEAIVKARGLTMAESLTTLTVDLTHDRTHPGYEDAPEVSNRAECRLTTFETPDSGLMGAVAVVGDLRPRLRLEVLSVAPFD
jgi:4'-phosphopantetheinyl transferase